ncbi:interferon alpha-inducible protein 27-like protein 2 isoform X2 [Rhincodon typus]|uniref:interferon alpha-inducible protein 27-like protein 2 isoform X2 n=1 Tax=Rhincodon typus TaxID=259920 RepID=UPI00202FF1E8|nr:interferon alpha-inducible protein 27-like protein 2 isoform X2 [Rhincodon typus]
MKMHFLALLILICSFSTVDASGCFKLALISLGAASGITVGSWAAKLESIVSSLNGGTVPSGSFVITLQSIGTAGFAFSTMVLLGVVGALISIIIGIKLGIF